MNNISKLLESDNEEDNELGLLLLRAKNPDNWGAFIMELQDLTKNKNIKVLRARFIKGTEEQNWEYPLKDRYFHPFADELRYDWNQKIK